MAETNNNTIHPKIFYDQQSNAVGEHDFFKKLVKNWAGGEGLWKCWQLSI